MRSKIIPFLTLAAALGGLLVWGYVQNGSTVAAVQGVSAAAPSALTAAETLYDFGTISMAKGNVTKEFTLTNPTAAALAIRGVETSCMCTTAFLVTPDGPAKGPFGMSGMGGATAISDTLAPGETRVLRVVYNPAAHGPAGVGAIDRFITVTDATGGTLRFEIKAMVTP